MPVIGEYCKCGGRFRFEVPKEGTPVDARNDYLAFKLEHSGEGHSYGDQNIPGLQDRSGDAVPSTDGDSQSDNRRLSTTSEGDNRKPNQSRGPGQVGRGTR